MGSYNHEEFVAEVNSGGDGRGGGEASCGMSGSRTDGKAGEELWGVEPCGDQVFGGRVTTSTLAGEYVTARGYVGGRASG